MATSRNAREFLERAGLRTAVAAPRPRLDLRALLVNQLPLDGPLPEQRPLLDYEGEIPPDRGETKAWPNQK